MADLYRVAVTETRWGYIYVMAETSDAAQEDARVFAENWVDDDWKDTETDVDVKLWDPATVPPDQWVWTGGEDGAESTVGFEFPVTPKEGT